jgi:hypothetical protein
MIGPTPVKMLQEISAVGKHSHSLGDVKIYLIDKPTKNHVRINYAKEREEKVTRTRLSQVRGWGR